jgi:hypothetical protein
MNLVRREGFVTALRQGILWYSTAQQEHSPEAAEVLAQRFAEAVDHTSTSCCDGRVREWFSRIARAIGAPWSKSPLNVG